MSTHENAQYDAPTPEDSAGDPLADLAATAVERTASVRDPEAIPPVAGAADPQVLATGVTPSPVTEETPEPPPADERDDAAGS